MNHTGGSVLPPACERTCEANYMKIEGEYLAQCACVRRCEEEHISHRVKWNQDVRLGATIQDPLLRLEDIYIHGILLI